MTACEQTGDGEFYRLVLSYNNFANLLRESVNVVAHPETICGNDALRKQDLRGVDLPSSSSSNAGSGDVTFCVRVDSRTRSCGGAPGLPAVASAETGGRALPT